MLQWKINGFWSEAYLVHIVIFLLTLYFSFSVSKLATHQEIK